MKRKLPPLAAIRAFESAARLGSFTDAAVELNVTQSAISHQVKRLETLIGRDLFLRSPRGIALTAIGKTYLGELTGLLDRLDDCTQRLVQCDIKDVLRIQATPAFITRWLLPRMHSFSAEYPELDYDVTIGFPPTDFSRNDVDIYIHWGTEPVEGACVEPFFQTAASPVASKRFLQTAPALRQPRDLLKVPLLFEKVDDGWAEWFKTCGITLPASQRGPRFAHCDLAYTAAEAGEGVALAYLALVEREIADGRLVRLFEHETTPSVIYSLAYRQRDSSDPKIQGFRDWIHRGCMPAASHQRQLVNY
jgi:LysR family glycine cleavage system transcriptional activator